MKSAAEADMRIVPLGSGGAILYRYWFLNDSNVKWVKKVLEVERKDDLLANCQD